MGRDDDWDDDDDFYRSRRRRDRDRYDDDDDDYDLSRRGFQKSGSVTGVGVVSIILGSLDLLIGLCVGFVVVAFGNAGLQGEMGMPGAGAAMAVVLIILLLVLLWGALAIAGGIGVLNRKHGGRMLILIVSGVAAATGLFCFVISFAALSDRANMGNAPDTVMGALVFIVLAIVLIAYCIWSYVVLLNGQNASEFR